MSKRKIGQSAEDLAEIYFRQRGYDIIAKNYRCKTGEIDLIVRRGDQLVFVEVKGATTDGGFPPEDKVDLMKRRKIISAAEFFCLKNSQILDKIRSISFDVVVVNLVRGEIKHYESAFFVER
ncbi:MAG: YraN family protein [Caldimicrobium sp.]|nr:YraN family protein [Caldimicrobium sp.]MCX7874375.1 YraN family protein [Caldimicrobium sp.]MDW8093501.1 YraN family protein [Caldimicrobium sp.]